MATTFKREVDALPSVRSGCGTDWRELSESMYEGLATIRETHAELRDKTRNRGYQHSSSSSSHSIFGFSFVIFERNESGENASRGQKGSVNQRKLVTLRFDCNHFGHWSGDLIFRRRIETSLKHRRDVWTFSGSWRLPRKGAARESGRTLDGTTAS